jgi:hypothetical protein
MSSTAVISTTALVLIPAIAALCGAAIGSAASVISTLIHERNEHRRDRNRRALEAALHVHSKLFEATAAAAKAGGGGYVRDLAGPLLFYTKLLELIDENRLTLENLTTLNEELRTTIKG